MIALVGGTVFVMWLAEQITARGLGRCIFIDFAGIIAEVPGGIAKMFSLGSVGQISPAMIALIIGFVVGIIALIAFMEQAQRRINTLPKALWQMVLRIQCLYLPIKVNMSGVMGPVFASSIMMLPAFLQRFVHESYVQSIRDFYLWHMVIHGIVHDFDNFLCLFSNSGCI